MTERSVVRLNVSARPRSGAICDGASPREVAWTYFCSCFCSSSSLRSSSAVGYSWRYGTMAPASKATRTRWQITNLPILRTLPEVNNKRSATELGRCSVCEQDSTRRVYRVHVLRRFELGRPGETCTARGPNHDERFDGLGLHLCCLGSRGRARLPCRQLLPSVRRGLACLAHARLSGARPTRLAMTGGLHGPLPRGSR